jgi:deoxyribonuclease-4
LDFSVWFYLSSFNQTEETEKGSRKTERELTIMKFGFHISIAGGFSKVVERAQKKKCESIQIFSRNPRGWKYGAISAGEAKVFRKEVVESNIDPVFLHLPYLPNLASPQKTLFKTSISSLKEELRRCKILGAQFVISHIGKRLSSSEKDGIERIAEGINTALRTVKNDAILLLENTAGQGSEIGFLFPQIREILDRIEENDRLGVCLDTAHAFSAGYDLSTEKGVEKTIEEFHEIIGIERLKVIHLNDSKVPLGSRKDRHWHIGKGEIGLEGFRAIVNHLSLNHLPGIMETPRESDADDLRNMRTLRKLRRQSTS